MQNRTWLQGVGAAAGKPAGELVVGDVMGWNCGYTSTVTAIVNQSPAFITIEEEWLDSGGQAKRSNRRLKRSRIVAIVTGGKLNVLNVTKEMCDLAA